MSLFRPPTIEGRAIFKGLIDLCWFTIKWGLLLAAVAALVAAPYLYHRVDEEIRTRIESRLTVLFPHLRVSVRSAQLVSGEGVVVRGLSLQAPDQKGPITEIAAFEEVFISCNTDLRELVGGKVDVRKIAIRRPTVRFWKRSDGTWNASQLLPVERRMLNPPPITITGGVVEIYDLARSQSPVLRLRDAELTVNGTIEQPLIAGGRSPFRVEGTLATDFLRGARVNAVLDPDGRAWRAGGAFDSLIINPNDWQALPGLALPVPEILRGFRATGQGQWTIDYLAGRATPLEFNLTTQIADGRIDDYRLVYPVTDLRADLICNAQGLRISNLSARHGQAAIRCDLQRMGYGDKSPMRVTAQGRNLHLDNKYLELLPPKLQTEWHKYMPTGEIDADVQLDFDGVTWRPQVVMQCINVSFTHYKFPYRLDRGRGTIEFRDRQINCNLTAQSDNAEVRIAAQVEGPSSPPLGWVEIRGEQVRLDEKLLFAMPEKAANVVRTLHPTGNANAFYRWWHDAKEPGTPHQFAQINLNRCSMRYEKFAYPIDEVTGVVEMHDRNWYFRDLRGNNDRGRIVMNGQLTPVENGNELALQTVATNIAFEDELRDALTPGVQQLWKALKPRGMLNVTTDIQHRPGDRSPRVWVRAEPVVESVSIEPVHFPYRLENARGVFVFSDGRVTIDNFKAEHGRATVTAHGVGSLLPSGGWGLHLEHFHWDRLVADREFVAALPGRLRKLFSNLNVEGPISLRGAVDLLGGGPADESIRSEWDIDVDFQQATLNCGMRLDNLNGGITLAGNFDGQQFRCRGDISLDSVLYRDQQFSDVRGPLWIDDSRLLVGYWADRVRDVKPERRLTARVHGGNVVADGWVNLGAEPRYQLNAALEGADLASWRRQMMPGQNRLSGEVLATLDLRGKGSNVNDLNGRGTIQMRNADIYELPLMVSLLKLFSTIPPDATAFTTSDVDFRIQGEHFYVDRIELNGDAISLLGKGEVGMNRQINLAFYAVVGRDESRTQMMRSLLGGASQQIMQIHAEGTLDQPIVRREAFPVVSQAWQSLQADFQAREDARRKTLSTRGLSTKTTR